jgi:DNA adenine methylase
MKYMGSKDRHFKDMSFFLTPRHDQKYIEPFVGGANVIANVNTSGHRIGADIDEDLICLWQAVSEGWMPPNNFTEDDYYKIKMGPVSPLRGYAAFALSYGGKKFGGWRRDKAGKRNYVDEAYRNAMVQFPKLRGVEFVLTSYTDLMIPDGSFVYCDPPYEGTTSYSTEFCHNTFWEWVRDVSRKNTVLVSEYSAPEDFVCVWKKEVKSSLTENTGGKKATEKLFTLI